MAYRQIDHDLRRRQILDLLDGRRRSRDLAVKLAPVWGLKLGSTEVLIWQYLISMEKDGQVHRPGTWKGAPYLRGPAAAPQPPPQPPPLPAERPPRRVRYVPTEAWTLHELHLWLTQMLDLPPHRVQDLVTPEQVRKAADAARAAIDEQDRLKKGDRDG